MYRLGRSVTKHDEPVLYYLLDGPERGLFERSFWWCPPTLSYHWMGFSIEVDPDTSVSPVGYIPMAWLIRYSIRGPVLLEVGQ